MLFRFRHSQACECGTLLRGWFGKYYSEKTCYAEQEGLGFQVSRQICDNRKRTNEGRGAGADGALEGAIESVDG